MSGGREFHWVNCSPVLVQSKMWLWSSCLKNPGKALSFRLFLCTCACVCVSVSEFAWELASYLIHHSARGVLTGNCRCSQAVLCSKPSHHWARGTCCMHVLDADSHPTCVSLLGQRQKEAEVTGSGQGRRSAQEWRLQTPVHVLLPHWTSLIEHKLTKNFSRATAGNFNSLSIRPPSEYRKL